MILLPYSLILLFFSLSLFLLSSSTSPFSSVSCTIYFKDSFTPDSFSRWVQSTSSMLVPLNSFILSHGQWYSNRDKDLGLSTTVDASHYAASARIASFAPLPRA